MRKRTNIPVEESFATWRKNPAYTAAYEALGEEFAEADETTPSVSDDEKQTR